MPAKTNAPVIIKRKKIVSGAAHHGGAWKVAYADFVTAMMAFFMLMWLLNATTESQRKGIADYFNPTIPIARVSGGGDGSLGGDSIFSEQTLARSGLGGTARRPAESDAARGDTGVETQGEATDVGGADELEKMNELLLGRGGESMTSELERRHIVTRLTDEGLIIELFDLPGQPLFEADGDQPAPILEALTDVLVEVTGLVTNDIAVTGHLAAKPVVLADNPNWPLSTARASRLREMLETRGLAPERLQRVTGFADRKPVTANRTAVRNNRVEVIVLRDKL